MSRSGYSDDCDGWALIRWRGAVKSAIRGKRGQALLQELVAGLDSMPVKELIDGALETDGQYCALGVVGRNRGLEMGGVDPENRKEVSSLFKIAPALAAEIAFENDDDWREETPAARWGRMRHWAISKIEVA